MPIDAMFPALSDISRRRRRLGMTQNRLAKLSGVSQSLVTKIERGLVVPNYTIACEMFDVLEREEHRAEKKAGDVMHPHVILLSPSNKVSKAVALAKRHAVSQFPVVSGGVVVGSITTGMLVGIGRRVRISDIMNGPFPSVPEDTPVSGVASLLRGSQAVIVVGGGEIRGIITAENLLGSYAP